MSNGIYLTLEQYKDKDLPITITINGHTYHSQFALATTQTTWFEMGKQHGMELGADNTYSDKEMSRMHDAWYDEGYKKGYEAGKSESYGKGWIEGQNEASIKQFDEYSVKLEERYKSKYDAGFNDGYEQCKHDGISKINLNTESVEQSELSKEYDKGFTKGYEEGKEEEFDRGWAYGYDAGKEEGYEIGKKANGISKKEIPGEYLAHIEEAYDDGYKEGYTDCREVAKMLNKYGIDEDGPCNDCKEEPGRDEDGPEQTEYAKGYEEGYAEGKEAGYEEGFMNLRFLIKK
jgi:flagellar biosynthesis/type III secretory pathway protein FliH